MCSKHVQSSLVLAGFDTHLMGRACIMFSNNFLSLMVAGKCFVTRYAVKFVNIIWYTFDRIFYSPGIVKLCCVSGSTHLSTYRVQRHLCFDGLKASRTFAIRLNSEIPRFISHACHLFFDQSEVSQVVLFYQNLVCNDSLAKDRNYFCDFSQSMQPGIGKSLLAEQNFAFEQVTVRIQLSAVRL